MDIITQIITTFSLILGVIIGETISNKYLGKPRNWYLNVTELFLFIIILIMLFNNTYLTQTNPLIMAPINFFFGTIAITTTRGITSGAGFFSKKIIAKNKLRKEINEEVIITGLARNLAYKGFNKEQTINLLSNTGLNKNKIKRITKQLTELSGTEKNKIKNS